MINMTKILIKTLCCAFLFLWSTTLPAQQLTKTKVKNIAGKEISIDSLNHYSQVLMQQLQVPGISMAIINEGQVVYHNVQGYADVEQHHKVTKNTVFEAASLSKPLFAFFVMNYVERGLLDLDTPLYQYMPYEDIAHDERYKKITARMVLSHTTGFPNWRDDYEKKELFIQFDPGTSFFYSGEGYQYLAKVLMHLSDTDDSGLEQIYQNKIAKPLQLEVTKFVQNQDNLSNKAKGYEGVVEKSGNDDPATFGAAFSIHSEALDFSKWLIALLDKKLISESSYEELFKTQVVLPEDHEQRQLGVSAWTLGFAKADFPFGAAFGHGGNNPGYTSLFVIIPETKWGVVVFTNANQSQLPLTLLQYLMTP